MRIRNVLAFSLILTCLGPIGARAEPPIVDVTTDTSEVPDLAPWAAEAKELVNEWYPKVVAILATEGFSPPSKVALVFQKDKKGVADASGTTIRIAADWVRKHPEDKGMVIHEMTHVIQSYRRGRVNAGWLVEGIADYVRYVRFEPDAPPKRIDPNRAKYTDAYNTTARFLAWIEKTYDRKIVSELNDALRHREYDPELFPIYTGRTLDELWAAFIKSLKAKK
jgi:Peptidase of plants and bacteria